MHDATLKRSILSMLASKRNLSTLATLQGCGKNTTRSLLYWLDQSGLALHLYRRLQRENALDLIRTDLRQALEQRVLQNRVRVDAMLSEFSRLNESFANHGVHYSAVKGFTLIPEYCPDPYLRHQTDFDFMIAPDSASNAARALASCGYELQESGASGQLTFGTPLLHVPTRRDNIYDVPRHRQVDLHSVLWHGTHCVSIAAPTGCLDRIQRKRLLGVSFPSIAADDTFLLQVFHAFQHLLASWVRLSWLLELDHFIGAHEHDEAFWQSVRDRAGDDNKLRRAFGLVLRLTSQIFPRRLPPILEEWCIAPLPRSTQTWVRQFGLKWAISDLPGRKVTLFVHRDFVDDPAVWRKYLRGRIFPLHFRSPSGLGVRSNLNVRVNASIARFTHQIRRAILHIREMASLALDAIRWRRILRAMPRQSGAIQAD